MLWPWKPIVADGATGSLGRGNGRCRKSNAAARPFCCALRAFSGAMPHRCCMNDRMEMLVVRRAKAPCRAQGLTITSGVRVPYPVAAGGGTGSQKPPPSS